MTDNEKAATFIGWRPEVSCSSWVRELSPNPDREHGKLGICEHGKYALHDLTAPDMSRPENYMRALEVIAASDRRQCWGVYIDVAAKEVSFSPDMNASIRGMRDIACSGNTVAEAVVAALTALWDKENPVE